MGTRLPSSPIEGAGVTPPGEDLGRRPKVVLVDVRQERRAVMRRVIEQALGEGTVVAQVGTASEALAAAELHLADVAVVEIQLPLTEGLAVIAALRAAQPGLVIVVCTFHSDSLTQQRARDAGADTYLLKPVNARELRRVVRSGRPTPLAVAGAG
jgi:DNA-binding response OmpR family regulator